MTPQQITELFETMAGGLAQARRPADGTPPAPPPPPPPLKKDDVVPYFDPNNEKFDPFTGVDLIVKRNYGQLVGDIAGRTIRASFYGFEQQFPDFKEYEPDILKAMKDRDPTTVSEQDILSSYLAHKGLRLTLREQAEAAKKKGVTTIPPSGRVVDIPEPELSDVEKDVARRMFAGRKDKDGKPLDAEKEYRRFAKMEETGEGFTVKVPVGGGKYE